MVGRPFQFSAGSAVALLMLLPGLAAAESLSVRMRATEERISVDVDEFKSRKFYETALADCIQGATEAFYPYISYNTENGSRALFGYLRTRSSDWLMLKGVVVLVGEKRYSYYPDPLDAIKMRGSDCYSTRSGVTCLEWLHLPAKKGEKLFKTFVAIAEAPDSVQVRVRADGSEGSADWTLTRDERQAWKDIVFYHLNFSLRTK